MVGKQALRCGCLRPDPFGDKSSNVPFDLPLFYSSSIDATLFYTSQAFRKKMVDVQGKGLDNIDEQASPGDPPSPHVLSKTHQP